MNRFLQKVLVAAVLYFLSPQLFSQDDTYDAVYLRLTKTYTLNPDSSMDFRYQKEQKLMTYRAFSSLYGESFIVYSPEYQSLKINESYTIMANGKKVASPPNAFNEVLPRFAADAPYYNNLREMVVTHTGLEKNAVENIDYVIHSKKGFYPALMGNELLAEQEPVKELIIKVRIPSSGSLYYFGENTTIQPEIKTEGQMKVYTWKLTNIAAIPQEENQVSSYGAIPRLIFSTSNDREKIYEGFLSQKAFEYSISEEMKNAVFSVLADNKENLSIALKLQEKVISEFNLWPVPMRYTGFTCRPAIETWNSNGGTLTEKAVLLCALLKAADIQAEPVFVVPEKEYDKSIGMMMDMEDIIVAAFIKEFGTIYLSVSSMNQQNLSYSSGGRLFVFPRKNEKPGIVNPREPKNKAILAGSFTVDNEKKLAGDLSMTFGFSGNPWLLLARDKKKAGNTISGGISSRDLKEMKISSITPDESFFTYSVKDDKPFKKDTNLYFFELPALSTGVESFGIHLLPAERIANLEIPSLVDESYDFTFELPEGMYPLSPEVKKEIRNPIGAFLFETGTKGNKITVKKSIRIEKRIISPEQYPEFKALMDQWNSEHCREMVFTE